jgi:hypothetical protein
MRRIWLMEVKGFMFEHKKIFYLLKLKMYVRWSNVFSLPRLFLEL